MTPTLEGSGDPARRDGFHWLLLATIIVVAACLRFWRIRECGLSMWDEYDYVKSARWIASLGHVGGPHAPDVAPPLFPLWVGVCFLVAGFHDYVAIGASALASLLTLGAVYLLGWRMFGSAAALVGTAFLAGNLYNLIFAHQAITDATFQLAFVVAVHALFVWLRTGRRPWLVWSGLWVGLCQNIKYNGFFAWCVIVAWSLVRAARKDISWRLAGQRLVSAGVVGGIVSLPWLALVSREWGLGRLLRHYVGYSYTPGGSHGTLLHLWTYLTLWCGPLFLLLAAVGFCVALRQREDGDLVLVAWTLLFGLGSCAYFAYPRLILPMTAALALLAGRAAALLLTRVPRRWLLGVLCVAAITSEAARSWGRMGPFGAGYRAAGEYLATQVPSGTFLAAAAQPVLWLYYGRVLPDLLDPVVRERLSAGDPLVLATDLSLNRARGRDLLLHNVGRFELVRDFDSPVSEPDILTTIGREEFRRFRRTPDDSRWDDLRRIRIYRVTGPWTIGDRAP